VSVNSTRFRVELGLNGKWCVVDYGEHYPPLTSNMVAVFTSKKAAEKRRKWLEARRRP
jgi:hypothetical protein